MGEREDSQGMSPSRIVFKQLLGNGKNMEDTAEVETLILMLHYGRLSGLIAAPADAPTLKGSKQIHSISSKPWFGGNLKAGIPAKITMKNMTSYHWWQWSGKLIRMKIDKSTRVSWPDP